MTRAPILSAAAAALLLSLAAMGPLAAEDAATPAAPAMTPAPSASPAPAKGEFDNSCAMALAVFATSGRNIAIGFAPGASSPIFEAIFSPT